MYLAAIQCGLPPGRWSLGFGYVGIGFDFLNLLGVAFAVRADEKDEFAGIPFRSDGAVDGVVAESRSVFEKFLGLGALSTKWLMEPCGEAKRLVGLSGSGA
jgi:hypothetical protein